MSDHRVLIVSSELILSQDNPIINMSDHGVLIVSSELIPVLPNCCPNCHVAESMPP